MPARRSPDERAAQVVSVGERERGAVVLGDGHTGLVLLRPSGGAEEAGRVVDWLRRSIAEAIGEAQREATAELRPAADAALRLVAAERALARAWSAYFALVEHGDRDDEPTRAAEALWKAVERERAAAVRERDAALRALNGAASARVEQRQRAFVVPYDERLCPACNGVAGAARTTTYTAPGPDRCERCGGALPTVIRAPVVVAPRPDAPAAPAEGRAAAGQGAVNAGDGGASAAWHRDNCPACGRRAPEHRADCILRYATRGAEAERSGWWAETNALRDALARIVGLRAHTPPPDHPCSCRACTAAQIAEATLRGYDEAPARTAGDPWKDGRGT